MRYALFCLALLPLACGREETAPQPAKPGADLGRFELPTDPGASLSVRETKEKGQGEEVVVVGRVNRIVKGFATFNLVDTSLEYCGQGKDERCCDSPWDYC